MNVTQPRRARAYVRRAPPAALFIVGHLRRSAVLDLLEPRGELEERRGGPVDLLQAASERGTVAVPQSLDAVSAALYGFLCGLLPQPLERRIGHWQVCLGLVALCDPVAAEWACRQQGVRGSLGRAQGLRVGKADQPLRGRLGVGANWNTRWEEGDSAGQPQS